MAASRRARHLVRAGPYMLAKMIIIRMKTTQPIPVATTFSMLLVSWL